MVTMFGGMSLPLIVKAFFTAKLRPPQQGTVIPFDRQKLADYLEVDRSGLSAQISKLRREGILKSEKNHFTLL